MKRCTLPKSSPVHRSFFSWARQTALMSVPSEPSGHTPEIAQTTLETPEPQHIGTGHQQATKRKPPAVWALGSRARRTLICSSCLSLSLAPGSSLPWASPEKLCVTSKGFAETHGPSSLVNCLLPLGPLWVQWQSTSCPDVKLCLPIVGP